MQLLAAVLRATLLDGATLYVENVDIFESQAMVAGDADARGAFIANNVRFYGGNHRIGSAGAKNCLSITDLRLAALFNCLARHGARDGFNYHYSGVPLGSRRQCLALEYGCRSDTHGIGHSTAINNASTAHEGVTTLRVGGEYSNSRGPVIADVNGTMSVMHGCHAHDSVAPSNNDIIAVTDAGSSAWLYDCRAGGVGRYDLQATEVPHIGGRFGGHRLSVPTIDWLP